ncbi:MAG: serine hydrolase domain-containing protein [Microscillaceae bacterium]
MANCADSSEINPQHPKAKAIKSALEELLQHSVPGFVAAIHDQNGEWAYAGGLAKIENQSPMQLCHLQYLQSIAKTYTAVLILKLWETGQIDLEKPITDYLPENISAKIYNASNVTVKMLLHHTSGITEYNYAPAYVTKLLQEPAHLFKPEEYFRYVVGKKQDFEPGSRYSYRNVNYLILALIVENITGNHQKYMEETIFKPLELKNTYYRIEQGNTYDGRLVNSYWDRHSNAILENVSVLQNTNVASLIGDDGIITSPHKALRFLKGLMEGKLIAPQTLEKMKEWVLNRKGAPAYGLGLAITKFGGHTALGHSGGGLGAGCHLYYFP